MLSFGMLDTRNSSASSRYSTLSISLVINLLVYSLVVKMSLSLWTVFSDRCGCEAGETPLRSRHTVIYWLSLFEFVLTTFTKALLFVCCFIRLLLLSLRGTQLWFYNCSDIFRVTVFVVVKIIVIISLLLVTSLSFVGRFSFLRLHLNHR